MKFLSLKKLYKAHVYIGVFISIHFLVLSLTGSVLLLKDQIRSKKNSVLQVSQVSVPYEAILQNALSKNPLDYPLALFPDENDSRTIQLRMGKEGSKKFRDARKLSYDAITGQVQSVEAPKSDLISFALTLHRELFLGSWGKIYVGLIGFLFVFTLISGFIVYGNFMRGRSFAEIRQQFSFQVWADIHKLIGVSVFGWALLVGTTGIFLAFNSTLIKVFQYRELRYLKTKYSPPLSEKNSFFESHISLDEIVSSVLEARPSSKISYIAFPNTEFSIPNYFLVLVNGTGALTKRVSEMVVVDAHTGKSVEVLKLPFYLKVVMFSEPLHFGNYGGVFLKTVWFVFSCLSMMLAGSGLTTFVLKKKKNGASEKRRKKVKISFSNHPLFQSRYSLPLCFSTLILCGALVVLLTQDSLQSGLSWISVFFVGIPAIFTVFIVASFLVKVRNHE